LKRRNAAALAAFLVGAVYLATSTSRDVRIVNQKMLEKERARNRP
jgi:hypothetical protein